MLRSKIFVFLQNLRPNLAKLNLSQNSIDRKHVIVFWFPVKTPWRACSVVEFVRKILLRRFPHRHRSLAVQGIIFMVLAISILFGCIVIKVMGWGENSILQKQHQSHQNQAPTTKHPNHHNHHKVYLKPPQQSLQIKVLFKVPLDSNPPMTK